MGGVYNIRKARSLSPYSHCSRAIDKPRRCRWPRTASAASAASAALVAAAAAAAADCGVGQRSLWKKAASQMRR